VEGRQGWLGRAGGGGGGGVNSPAWHQRGPKPSAVAHQGLQLRRDPKISRQAVSAVRGHPVPGATLVNRSTCAVDVCGKGGVVVAQQLGRQVIAVALQPLLQIATNSLGFLLCSETLLQSCASLRVIICFGRDRTAVLTNKKNDCIIGIQMTSAVTECVIMD